MDNLGHRLHTRVERRTGKRERSHIAITLQKLVKISGRALLQWG